MKFGVSGNFTLTVRRADGSIREQLEFKNLITNNGMDRIAGPAGAGAVTPQALWNTCLLSTNSVAPAVTDTTMGGTTVSSTTSSATYPNENVSDGSPTYQFRMRAGFRFNTGAATGTWSSIGLMFSTGSVLFCKTLISVSGVPTALTITATESLDIRYELRVLPIITDYTGSVTINTVPYAFTARVYGITDTFAAVSNNASLGDNAFGYDGALLYGASIALGAITAGSLSASAGWPHTGVSEDFNAGGNRNPDTRTWAAYTSGTFSRDITYVWASTKLAASGLVNGMTVRLGGIVPPYQFVFTTSIPKGPTQQLSLTFTASWTRT